MALGALMLSVGGTLGGVTVAIPAMFAFLAFNLLTVPCMAAVAAARGELGGAKALWFAVGFWLLTAYVVSAGIFWFGVLAAVAWWAALVAGIVAVGAVITVAVLKHKGIIKPRKKKDKAEKGEEHERA